MSPDAAYKRRNHVLASSLYNYISASTRNTISKYLIFD